MGRGNTGASLTTASNSRHTCHEMLEHSNDIYTRLENYRLLCIALLKEELFCKWQLTVHTFA